jgi:hypothetical protein
MRRNGFILQLCHGLRPRAGRYRRKIGGPRAVSTGLLADETDVRREIGVPAVLSPILGELTDLGVEHDGIGPVLE